MSELAIDIQNVSRSFKRYRNQRYRVLDALGLRMPKGAFDEFWALKDISIQIPRGERLGFIGRNGAGKSTLLNLICGALLPTQGKISVTGRIQALMEMGTGFHPEFTGRENVFASLAYQGMTGRAARQAYEEIVEFSELQDFIAYPIKTYSAGMYARLAFATATAIVPDILIVDEVLGAGDAYFASKSTERMRRLTVETGATVLFVSHDISSVQRLCDRAIWIERGEVRMDGDTLAISKAYYASILEQEEQRLQAETSRAIARLRRGDGAPPADPFGTGICLFHFVPEKGGTFKGRHPIRRLTIKSRDGRVLEIRPGAAMDNDRSREIYLETDPKYMCWSAADTIEGQPVRHLENNGGEYRHAPFAFPNIDSFFGEGITVEVEHRAAGVETVALEIHHGRAYHRVGILQKSGGEWGQDTFEIQAADLTRKAAPESAEEMPAPDEEDPVVSGEATEPELDAGIEAADPDAPQSIASIKDKWNSTEAAFLAIEPCNPETGAAKYVFSCGEAIAFRILVEAFVPLPEPWIVLVLYDTKGERVALVPEKLEGAIPAGKAEIRFALPDPNIRQGQYVCTFELLPEFMMDIEGGKKLPFFAHWDRSVFFKVEENIQSAIELGLVRLKSEARFAALNRAGAGSGERVET